VDALDMLLVAGLVLLILRQVMPIAARLAGGVALASHGVMGAAAARGLGMARSGGAYAGRSALDRAAMGYEAWRSGRVANLAQASAAGQTTVSALAAATKVTPAWRTVRGG
jgi:hypothetical protein